MKRKIRMGMVGGGRGAFIGAVHRHAAALDGLIELVCGAFSSSPEKSIASGEDLMLPSDRCYGTFEEMFEKEKAREDGMDVVAIVTPNHMHFAPAKMALENGFHVICDKPVTFSLEEARELKTIVDKTGLLFALTHNYTGYPMIKHAKHLIKEGEIGKIRKIVVEYQQGWLSFPEEKSGENKQANWRTDPKKSGKAGAVGDIGTHAENLAEYVTGLQISELCADLTAFGDGRVLDDDANMLLRFNNGAKGVLHCSQVANGEQNGLTLRVYGETGSLHWKQEVPQYLQHKTIDGQRTYQPSVGELSAAANNNTRIPFGHPEGYLEAFANIYKNFANTLSKTMNGETPNEFDTDYPTIEDGIRGMEFIDAVIKSGEDSTWVKM